MRMDICGIVGVYKRLGRRMSSKKRVGQETSYKGKSVTQGS